METPASSFKLRANAPEGRKPISYQTLTDEQVCEEGCALLHSYSASRGYLARQFAVEALEQILEELKRRTPANIPR